MLNIQHDAHDAMKIPTFRRSNAVFLPFYATCRFVLHSGTPEIEQCLAFLWRVCMHTQKPYFTRTPRFNTQTQQPPPPQNPNSRFRVFVTEHYVLHCAPAHVTDIVLGLSRLHCVVLMCLGSTYRNAQAPALHYYLTLQQTASEIFLCIAVDDERERTTLACLQNHCFRAKTQYTSARSLT
jgi:hypothetical protein